MLNNQGILLVMILKTKVSLRTKCGNLLGENAFLFYEIATLRSQ